MIGGIPFEQLVGYIVGGIGLIAAVYERLIGNRKAKKTEDEEILLSDAKMHKERAQMFSDIADQNKQLFIAEAAEHQKTRTFWHDKASEYQKTLTSCQEKLADFQSQPNFSEIVRYIQIQAETSTKILHGIEELLQYFKARLENDTQ